MYLSKKNSVKVADYSTSYMFETKGMCPKHGDQR